MTDYLEQLREAFLGKSAPILWAVVLVTAGYLVFRWVQTRRRAAAAAGGPANYVSPRTVALYGILTALTAAVTYASYLPFSPTKGYFNIGDSMVFFSALTLGWRTGAICGGIGSATADVLLGSGIYAPLTLVAKGAEGLVSGVLGRRKPSRGWVLVLGAVIIVLAVVAMTLPKFPGDVLGIDMMVIQVAVVLAVLVIYVVVCALYMDKMVRWTPFLLAVAVGGTCMISGYFLGELYVLNVGLGKALAEVPVNILQVTFGGTIGILLSYAVKRSYPRLASE